MMKLNHKITNKGITLIALVITIIVLLILAGVALASLSGENGLLNKSSQAKEEAVKAQLKEEIEMAIMDIQAEEVPKGNNVTLESLAGPGDEDGQLEKHKDLKYGGITADLKEFEITGEYKGYNYTLDGNLEVTIENEIGDNMVGTQINKEEKPNYDDSWHICDGSILKLSDYPRLGKKRSDLVKNQIDYTPTFTSGNSRVECSGIADGNWPAYLAFSPTLPNNSGSGWLSQGGTGSKWISIDMENNTKINKMEITNIKHQDRENCIGAPIDFSIKGSYNNETYDNILSVTGNEHLGMGETYSFEFNDVEYRYYKIEITNGLSWWDGNLYYGFRFWKLLLTGDYIQLPNNPNQIIKVK